MTIILFTEKELAAIATNRHREIIINNIYHLYQIIDYVNLYIKERDNTPDCDRCGVCCSGVFDVTFVEAQVIREALNTNFIPPDLFPPMPEKNLQHRLKLARKQLAAALRDNHFVCPFYNNETGCLIYKVRTIICRVFEVAVPNFTFLNEVREELSAPTGDTNTGILCPNLKKAQKYPSTFAVWDLEGLYKVLEHIYPGSTTYERRLWSFFKYDTGVTGFTPAAGKPFKFKLYDYLKML